MKNKIIFFIYFILTITLVFSGGDKEETDTSETLDIESSITLETSDEQLALAKGPNGEDATRANEIILTDEDIEIIKQSNFTAAFLWAGSGEWYNALSDGAQDEFDKLGVEIVLKSDAQFDAAKQATDVETVLALEPDIILTLVVDPVSGARAFQPAVDAGVTLVFADNGVDGYEGGDEYVSIVTGDHFGMGRLAAELMYEALGGKGNVGFIFHDADYFVTNNRDNEFKRTIESKYPGIDIVAESGFTEEPRTEEMASAMLIQHPEINGIYVAWDVAAEGVIAALRAAGRYDIKVITHDLGANGDLDMAMDGNMYGKAIDIPYDIGVTMARIAVLELLGNELPPFVVVPSLKVTKENLVEAWKSALRRNPPPNILTVLGEN